MPPSARAMLAPSHRLPALDGLRGLAVLLVLLSHSSNIGMRAAPWLDLRGTGRYGVFLFFVLSAFLLTRQARRSDVLRPSTWGAYFLRRALRVLPAYFVCLWLYVWLEGWSIARAAAHFGMLRAELHFWTLPVEVLFYLVLPLLVSTLAVLRRADVGLLFLVALAVVVRLFVTPDYPTRPPAFRPNVLPFLPIFLGGAACALACEWWDARAWVQTRPARAAHVAGALALAAGVGIALHVPSVRQWLSGVPVEHTRFHLDFDRFGVLWSVVVFGVLNGWPVLRRVFELRALRFVGAVSFSLYLLHAYVLERVALHAEAWPGATPLLGFLGMSLSLAWLSYVTVERPCLGLGRRAAGGGRVRG
jgi:peptidoglycan/LPS O-acetylase OafA/YrhL